MGDRPEGRGRRRRLAGLVGVALGLVGLGLLAATFLSVKAALGHAQAGQDHARIALESVKAGDLAAAATELDSSDAELARATGATRSWWLAPVRAVPPVRRQLDGVAGTAGALREVTTTARDELRSVGTDVLRIRNGTVDTTVLRRLGTALDRIDAAAARAGQDLAQRPRAGLLAPLRARTDRVADDLGRLRDELATARDVVDVAPAVVGGDGERRYLVLFVNPAESRAAGGYAGAWGLLRAVDGRVELVRTGRADELAAAVRAGDPSPLVDPPADYRDRYDRFRPQVWPGDVGLSPDFPSVAAASAEIFGRATGERVDGVLSVDPEALGRIVELTGPVEVPSLGRAVAGSEIADLLLRGQYASGLDRPERTDLLTELAEATMRRLLDRPELPGPAVVGSLLGPVAAERRLLVHLDAPDEQAVIERLGLAGDFRAPTSGDGFAVVTQNGANNKLDAYLHRTIRYRPRYDPATGALHATLTVRLENAAPVDRLSADALGVNALRGLPPGDALTYVSVYSVLGLGEARVDGTSVATESQREQGFNVYSRYIVVPAGSSVELTVELDGRLPPGTPYSLVHVDQPVATTDVLDVALPSS